MKWAPSRIMPTSLIPLEMCWSMTALVSAEKSAFPVVYPGRHCSSSSFPGSVSDRDLRGTFSSSSKHASLRERGCRTRSTISCLTRTGGGTGGGANNSNSNRFPPSRRSRSHWSPPARSVTSPTKIMTVHETFSFRNSAKTGPPSPASKL